MILNRNLFMSLMGVGYTQMFMFHIQLTKNNNIKESAYADELKTSIGPESFSSTD